MKEKLKRSISTILCVLLSFSFAFPIASYAAEYGEELKNMPTKTYSQTFSDVPESYWAYTYISDLVERGLISGYPDGKFRPEDTITRAEFATIMVKAGSVTVDGSNTSTSFADMPNHWANPYVNAAKIYLTGYVINGANYYKPDMAALREDIAVALVKLKGYDISASDVSLVNRMFTDADSISETIKPYIAVALQNNLISGYEDSTFRGQNTISRSEAATLLWKAFQSGNANKVVVDDTTGKNNPSDTETTGTIQGNQSQNKADEEENNKDKENTKPNKQEKPPVKKNFKVETLKTKVKDLKDMIMTNSGDIYYISGNKIICDEGELDCTTDFIFELGYDDKNFDFTLEQSKLAYDEYHDKLYVLGLQESIPDRYGIDYKYAKLYEVTNFDNPTLIIDELLHEPDSEKPTFNTDIDFFSNGSLIYSRRSSGFSKSGIYLLNPSEQTKLLNTPDTLPWNGAASYIVGQTIYMVLSDEFYTYDIGFNKIDSISIEKYRLSSPRTFNNKFYEWQEDGLICVDAEGYSKVIIPSNDIELADLKPLSGSTNIEYFAVDEDENLIFYDSDSQAIRKIVKN